MDKEKTNIRSVLDNSPWWAPWAVLLVVLAMLLANSLYANRAINQQIEISQALRSANVEACERNNLLRTEFNIRGDILGEFLEAAAVARQRASDALPSDNPAQRHNQEAADRYVELSELVQPVDIINCETEFPPITR